MSYVTLRRLSKKYKGNASAPPNICSSLPWTEKAPARRGVGASRGESRQSGSKVRPFPLCREHWAEHFLSGVVAVTGTCSSLPNVCSLKPRQAPQTLGPVAYQGRLAANPENAHTRDDPRISTTCGMPRAMATAVPTLAQGLGVGIK